MATPAVLSARRGGPGSFLASGLAIIWAIALAKLLLHIYYNNRYGYFRDEFNYIACGDHLAWGYVDQPPLIPFLIHISRAVLGDSLRNIFPTEACSAPTASNPISGWAALTSLFSPSSAPEQKTPLVTGSGSA